MVKRSTIKQPKKYSRVTCKVRGCTKKEESGGLCEEHRVQENPYAGCLILDKAQKKALLNHIDRMLGFIDDAEGHGSDLITLIRKMQITLEFSNSEYIAFFEARDFFEGLSDSMDSYWEQIMEDLGIERQ